MDLDNLSRLIPLGGVTVLLVYLIGVIVQERRQATNDRRADRTQWQDERAELIAEHRAEMAAGDADRDRTIEYLRGRITELNEEAVQMRARLTKLEEDHQDCRTKILALQNLVRQLEQKP